MPYYLAPYIGAGTFLDPFRPRVSDQPGWSAIDLRPDGGATLGGGGLNVCLLHLPTHDPDPVLDRIVDLPMDTLPAQAVNRINSRLGVTLGQTRWQQIVEELLTRPPVNGWKPLRSTHDGWMEIYLGGLLSRWRPGSVGASISENWNCADSAWKVQTIDAKWCEPCWSSDCAHAVAI